MEDYGKLLCMMFMGYIVWAFIAGIVALAALVGIIYGLYQLFTHLNITWV